MCLNHHVDALKSQQMERSTIKAFPQKLKINPNEKTDINSCFEFSGFEVVGYKPHKTSFDILLQKSTYNVLTK